ncbi:lysozyme [Photobacterium aquae]|uniref:Lysozyme n=1 Tax=Photobacterium aquae TaxID=1195763 RepID=A0A0J1JNC4_9GAMM|nr:type VI secretion system baseplate subunit TssE [Photobacterium aquae]KLV03737.1 lysozyme [Photobacterium aquae]
MKASQALVPSLLDRLLDDAPENMANTNRPFTWRDMRHSVRRDLENLLNAKVHWHVWSKYYPELNCSLFSYGLPDFSAMPLSSLDGRQALCHIIEDTIRKFEPRFADVAVTVVGDDEPVDRILRLRIHALFHATPEAEEVTFDSEIEPICLGIRISEP